MMDIYHSYERSVLAGALEYEEKRYTWLNDIDEDYFTKFEYKMIYTLIHENKGLSKHDLILKIETLGKVKGFDSYPFLDYLDGNGYACESSFPLDEIKRFKRFRDVQQLFGQIDPQDPTDEAINALLEGVSSTSNKDSESITAVEAITYVADVILSSEKEFEASKKTGFELFDKLTGGIRKGLIALGAKPGSGKTTLALQLCVEYAKTHPNELVVFHSLEMSMEQLQIKITSYITNISSDELERGSKSDKKLSTKDQQKFARKWHNDTPDNLIIESHCGLSPLEMKARNEELVKKHKKIIGLSCVDYVQIMSADDPKARDELAKLTDISHGLRRIANKDYPILMLAQLQKGVDVTERPSMSNLKGSSQFEQDCAGIYMLYSQETGSVNCYVAKNRFGAKDIEERFTVVWNIQRFYDPIHKQRTEMAQAMQNTELP